MVYDWKKEEFWNKTNKIEISSSHNFLIFFNKDTEMF